MKFRSVVSVVTLFFCAAFAFAQVPLPPPTPQPPSNGRFIASGEAVALRLGGQWQAGSDAIEGLPVTRSVVIEGHQVLSPALNFQGIYGGAKYTPDITKLVSKTLLPANTFQPYIHGGVGVVRNTATSRTTFGAFVGGGINYSPNADGAFTITPFRVDYVNAPGFGTSPHGIQISAGIGWVFGK